MSASRSSYSRQERLFHFSMEFPVPSYLVALVAGDLQHVDVGPRSVAASCPGRPGGRLQPLHSATHKIQEQEVMSDTPAHLTPWSHLSRSRVWAEPCLLSCAVKKLGGSVERWLGVAEQLFGLYMWGR